MTSASDAQFRVIYGVYEIHQTLCVIEANFARELEAEILAVKACQTIGQAQALEPKLKHVSIPGGIEDLEDDQSSDDPWEWSEQPLAQGGDWPPMPDALRFSIFEIDDTEAWKAICPDKTGRMLETTVFNGDYLDIPVEAEQALLAHLDSEGIAYTRNDELIENIGM